MKRKNNTLIIIVVLIVLCLLLACVAALFVFRSSADTVTTLFTELVEEQAANLGGESVNPQRRALGASPVIYLAGRSDITIPSLGETSDISLFSCRDGGVIQETFPPGYRITPGASFTFQASGQTNFYGGPPEDGFPPDGDPAGGMAYLDDFGGISGYQGPAGALVAVFLSDAIPASNPPDALDFTEEGMGSNFSRLEPQVGQVFFIGDGRSSNGQAQTFVAPTNATRLFIGLADGAYFSGPPTCYADNTGSFSYQIESDQPYEPLP